MFELPLFPLNTVLFPGMPLPLHIFEERYKQMIKLCIDEQRPFGIVFTSEDEVGLTAQTVSHEFGCTARILQVQTLADERLLIMTMGDKRFRIVSLNHDKPYLVGNVELAPLAENWTDTEANAARRLSSLVAEYLDILSEFGEVTFNTSQLPESPHQLGYLASAFLQLPQEEKQPLLESPSIAVLLQDLYAIYYRELALMRTMPKMDQGMFSIS